MMNRRVETKEDGMYVIQEVGDKPIVEKIRPGWHVLFTDAEGDRRFGYVLKVDLEQRQFSVLDDIAYPQAPSPIGAKGEVIPFDAVIIAQDGFNWMGKVPIVDAGKKVGRRDIAIIIKGHTHDATVGWITRRTGRAYVDRRDGQWQVRATRISS